ncbi:Calmodulin-regulated spectrin-associated protein 1 [Galemys pyrenaicus]|uniref:Calmodulin-regulated spectrin-associated protein 1 n=1 Tax=Galemys pyrenaicus TaxID=202257 RepID=A0A8J6ADB3_GALPY|nr:Calmodulin-regulated spectrin-associated protein 1 [Galemys pyrenaicus]
MAVAAGRETGQSAPGRSRLRSGPAGQRSSAAPHPRSRWAGPRPPPSGPRPGAEATCRVEQDAMRQPPAPVLRSRRRADICLKEATSTAERLCNIRLLRDFADAHLHRCFHLALEDVLYAPLVLKPNIMVFIAELFWWFENVKPDFVQPRDVQELKDARAAPHPKGGRPPVPISNATKRSFLGSPASGPADLSSPPPPAEEPEHPRHARGPAGPRSGWRRVCGAVLRHAHGGPRQRPAGVGLLPRALADQQGLQGRGALLTVPGGLLSPHGAPAAPRHGPHPACGLGCQLRRTFSRPPARPPRGLPRGWRASRDGHGSRALASARPSNHLAVTEAPSCSGRAASASSASHPLLPLRQKQQKVAPAEEPPGEAAKGGAQAGARGPASASQGGAWAGRSGCPLPSAELSPTGQRLRSSSLTRVDGQPRGVAAAWPERRSSLPGAATPTGTRSARAPEPPSGSAGPGRSGALGPCTHRAPRCRPASQPAPFAPHPAASGDADPGPGDTVSLARSISKDSLASSVVTLTPQHQPHAPAQRADGRSLLSNVDIEDEDEELVAVARTDGAPPRPADPPDRKPDSFFLEPLLPAVLRPAKEKQAVSKEDECGEGRPRSSMSRRPGEGIQPPARKRAPSSQGSRDPSRTFSPVCCPELPAGAGPTAAAAGDVRARPPPGSSDPPSQGPSADGFFLHAAWAGEDSGGQPRGGCTRSPRPRDLGPWAALRLGPAAEVGGGGEAGPGLGEDAALVASQYLGEEESAKLQEDLKVKEHEDKDDASGRSSPCLSTVSQLSGVSVASGSVKMTSFAERKLQRLNSCEAGSSSSSSQKTTPDASESCPAPLTTWRQRREQSPSRQGREQASLLASELARLHMQLEEKRRAIEARKEKTEALSARQRLQLGKAAFLHVVKEGRAGGVPQPLRPEPLAQGRPQRDGEDRGAAVCEAGGLLVGQEGHAAPGGADAGGWGGPAPVQQRQLKDAGLRELEERRALTAALLGDGPGEGLGVGECDLSIEKLNETISTLQQAILKISQQQEQLLLKAPSVPAPGPKGSTQDQRTKAPAPCAEPPSPTSVSGPRKGPRPAQGRNSRAGRPAELKVPKDRPQGSPCSKTPTPSIEGPPQGRPPPPGPPPRTPSDLGGSGDPPEKGFLESYRLHDGDNQRVCAPPPGRDPNILAEQVGPSALTDGAPRSKASLIEVDLSDLKAPDEDAGPEGPDGSAELAGEGEQKSGVGFFFKDEQKAEDELAKKRAAFLLKQQRKAEEARLRKQQLEAEVELKRDEARRRAEEERVRKEEEKARRELIKQEYLRRKQQQILEEQGPGRPRARPRKPRPKSAHREESRSDSGAKCPSPPDDLSRAQSGSSLSLASAATTEPESVHSGGTPSQRVESLEALPVLSRNPSRSTDRDWETASAASSLASVAEYTGGSPAGPCVCSPARPAGAGGPSTAPRAVSPPAGPRLFKEPSSKSNKPIIHNALAHCCLAGKVNEPHKNAILEAGGRRGCGAGLHARAGAALLRGAEPAQPREGSELERCDANHYVILFRDAGCQFRALYCYYPDTEELCKLTGTGPRSITRKMTDKLYKYSSDRKQFSLIPAKTMSVSVDALTIHNHLWQPKRPAAPKKTQNRK